MRNCELCQYYDYDEQTEEFLCTAAMDEDDYARFLENRSRDCPFFRYNDEYRTARRQ